MPPNIRHLLQPKPKLKPQQHDAGYLSLRCYLSTWKAVGWPTAFVSPQQLYSMFLMLLCQASHPTLPPHHVCQDK